MGKHKATVTIIAAFGLVVFAQLLFVDTLHPSTTGDSIFHLATIERMAQGDWGGSLYLGEFFLGIPTVIVSKLFNVSIGSAFLWTEYLALLGVGVTLCLIISRIVGKKAGLLVIPIALLCTQSMLKLFSWGTIFSIVNMCIILPLALFCLAKWLAEREKRYAVASILLVTIFSLSHPSSLYLLYALGLFFAGYLTYSVAKGLWRETAVTASTGTAIVGINLLAVACLPLSFGHLHEEVIPKAATFIDGLTHSTTEAVAETAVETATGIGNFLWLYLSPATLGLLCIVIIGLVQYRKEMRIDRKAKLFLALLACFIPILAIGAFTSVGFEPPRHAADLSTIIAIIIACLAGVLLTHHKSRLLTAIIFITIAIGITPTLATWFGL